MTIDQFGRIRWQTDLADLIPAGASTVHMFQLRATDNRGVAESPVTVTLTVLPDTEAPRGAIQYAPEPGQTDGSPGPSKNADAFYNGRTPWTE